MIKISKIIFGRYFKDPSNKNTKFLRTKIRNLKTPLEKSGIKYDQILKSINNLALSRNTLDLYFQKIFKNVIKKKKKEILIDLKKFDELNNEIKMAVINESIKRLKQNYYSLRSKKINNLIQNLNKKDFKKSTLGGCIFILKKGNICLKNEKT